MRPAVFLDRDGVLNRVVRRGEIVSSPWSREEFELLPDVVTQCVALRQDGRLLVVVTNQPDVARGNLPVAELETMHAELQRTIGFDAIEVCMSSDDADPRRKPNPGMLLDAAQRLDIDLAASWIVGDSRKDLAAGRAAGVRSILLRTEYNAAAHGRADFEVDSFAEAVEIIRRAASRRLADTEE